MTQCGPVVVGRACQRDACKHRAAPERTPSHTVPLPNPLRIPSPAPSGTAMAGSVDTHPLPQCLADRCWLALGDSGLRPRMRRTSTNLATESRESGKRLLCQADGGVPCCGHCSDQNECHSISRAVDGLLGALLSVPEL